jgi:hypothetical protein
MDRNTRPVNAHPDAIRRVVVERAINEKVGNWGFDEKWLYKVAWLGSFRAPGQRA